MSTPKHSLFDYDPALYRMIHVGAPGDVEFYARACEGAAFVLELGCGWGRITGEICRVADEVVGLDINPAMIEAARDEVPDAHLVVGDMRDFSFDQRFDRIIIPYNGIYNLLTDSDLVACFECVEAHLAEDGRFIFDGYHLGPDMLREMRREGGVDYDLIGTYELDGRSVEVVEHSTYDVPARRFDAEYIYRFYNQDGTSEAVRCQIPQRFLLPDTLDEHLGEAGLALESVTGDFTDEALERYHHHMAVVAGRA